MGRRFNPTPTCPLLDFLKKTYISYLLISTPLADDGLRLSKEKKKLENVTQGMVDRCIMDEVRSFLVGTLTSPSPNRFVIPTGQQCDLPFYQPSTLIQGQVGGTHISPLVRSSVNVGNLVVNIGGNSTTTASKRVGSNGRSRKRSETKRQKQCK